VALLPVGGWLGLHRHAPTETYYVLDGEGLVTLDGVEHTIVPGTAVQIPSDIEHGVRNTGETPLRFVYVFAADSMAQVEYRFTAH
jgi:quercetin dioxygenase-like cupin family protein